MTFDANRFVEDCRACVAGEDAQAAVADLVHGALRDPEAIGAALGTELGKESFLYRDDDLTVLHATLGAGFRSPPHDHTIWAVIGIYDGQENNTFYRRTDDGLEIAGGRNLATGDVLTLMPSAIHAIENPLDRPTFGIHVYGGDLLNPNRHLWDPDTFVEEPLTSERLFEFARRLMRRA